MSADWGAQRIKGMSLWSAVWEPIRAKLAGARKDKSKQVTSLIEQFQYPKYGPGMMWERCHELVEAQGSKVVLRSKVTSIAHRGGKAVSVTSTDASGATSTAPVAHVISSMPFPPLLPAMDPQPHAQMLAAADDLSVRSFLSLPPPV